jgi:hypothetical protein
VFCMVETFHPSIKLHQASSRHAIHRMSRIIARALGLRPGANEGSFCEDTSFPSTSHKNHPGSELLYPLYIAYNTQKMSGSDNQDHEMGNVTGMLRLVRLCPALINLAHSYRR